MELGPEQKKKLFLGILIGLVGVIMIVAAVVLSLEKGSSVPLEDKPAASGLVIPDDKLLIDDLYEGRRFIPKFGLATNRYDVKKFTEKNGLLTYDSADAKLGVDVSEYQGDIDWAAVKGAGVDFAILRLGWRGTTQGLISLDDTFEQNYENAVAAGIAPGAYFFSQAISEAEAVAEADFVIDTLNGRELPYPVVFDWELPLPSSEIPADKLRAHNMNGKDVTKFARAFCEKIKEAGYAPCIYTNKSMAYEFFDLDKLKGYDLWYAEYQKAPSLYYDFRLWQYTETGAVPGIEGGVDINICFKPY